MTLLEAMRENRQQLQLMRAEIDSSDWGAAAAGSSPLARWLALNQAASALETELCAWNSRMTEIHNALREALPQTLKLKRTSTNRN